MRVDAKNFPVLKAALDLVWGSLGTGAAPPAYDLEGWDEDALVQAEGALDELDETDTRLFCTGEGSVQVAIAARTPELKLADRVLLGPGA